MPTDQKTARWKIVLGYVGFTLFAFVLCLYLTFPYEAVKQRAQREADAAGFFVKFGSIGPGLRGVTARDVRISKKLAASEDKPAEELVVQSISARPALFPPGVAFHVDALGGSISGSAGGVRWIKVDVEVDELDLSQGNLKGFSGVDLAGKVSAQLSISVPMTQVAGKGPVEPDLGAANGSVALEVVGLGVNGGTINVTIPMYGPEPTPIDLPKFSIGDLDGNVKIEKGAATIDKFAGRGPGLELGASGTVKLAKRLEYSETAVNVRLKTEPEFVKSLGIYGAGLSQLQSDPKDPSWRVGNLTGYLGKPNFR